MASGLLRAWPEALKWERKEAEAGSRGGQGCRLPDARGASSKQEGLAAPQWGGFGGGVQSPTGHAQQASTGLPLWQADPERLCGLPQVTQRGRGTGLDPRLPLLLLPPSWVSGAGSPASASHCGSWGAGQSLPFLGLSFSSYKLRVPTTQRF